MSVLKPYDVIVKTTAEWSGSVNATSLRHAKQLAEQAFGEGSLSQCDEDIETVIAFRPRKRIGSWDTFERRFNPMLAPNHDYLWDLGSVPKDADPRSWWTVLDCDGRLSLAPGFRVVDRFAFVRCAKPWSDVDYQQPGYWYDLRCAEP
jgi:hypothetical protein